MKVTITRFEGRYAICRKEDLSIMEIKRINIPIDATEGDILNIENDTIIIENKYNKEAGN